MKRLRNHRYLLAAVLAVVAACSSKSPTEPSSGPSSPKVPVSPANFNYVITVTASPTHLTVGSGGGSTVTVRAANQADGSLPPDLTPITLTTTLGDFNVAGSGIESLNLQLVHGQASAILFPGSSAGTATLAATIVPGASGPCAASGLALACSGSGGGNVSIGVAGTFFLNGVSPNTGDPAGGSIVTITGGGFAAPVSVTFGGSSATVRSVSQSAIQVVVPPASQAVPVGTTLPVSITVNNNLGGTSQANATLTNAFTYVTGGGGIVQPQVFSVTPASGTNDGGSQISIIGQGFVAPVQVLFGTGTAGSFNGVEATVQSVTATKIVVVSPPARGFGQDNTNQLVSLLVKNITTGFSTVAPGAFKYGSKVIITAAGPTQVAYNQQVKVTISGQGFADPVAVSLGGIAATVLSVTGTEIQVLSSLPNVTACSNISGPITVTNINNGDGASGLTFTYLVNKPDIQSLSPSSGPGGGGTHVTLMGVNFNTAFGDRVLFGDTAAIVTGNPTAGTIVVTAPPYDQTFPTTACTSGTSTGTMETSVAVDVVVTDPQTTCTDTLAKAFTYIPTDQSCHITPPTPPAAPVASFTFVTNNLTVIFHDTSTGPPSSWTWMFGDSATSNAQNPVHSYAAAGTYTVTLTVSNATGSSTTSQFVTVASPGP
jgi:hypothetical protein